MQSRINQKEQLEKDSRLDAECVCVEHDTLQNRSAHVEVRHKVLIDQLKDESCRVVFVNQEEECFEVEEIMSKINEEHKTCIKEEYFDEYRLESMSDDEKYFCVSCVIVEFIVFFASDEF